MLLKESFKPMAALMPFLEPLKQMSLLQPSRSEAKKKVRAIAIAKQTKELSKWSQTLSCWL